MALIGESKNFSAPDYDATAEQVALNTSHWGSEAPKVHMVITGVTGSASTISVHLKNSLGWATDSDDYVLGIGGHNGRSTKSLCKSVYSNAYCAWALTYNGGTYEKAEQNAYSATAVMHDWAGTSGDGYYYSLLALGGSNVEDVSIDVIDTATSTGAVSYTGPGFKPTCLIAMWNGSTAVSAEEAANDACIAMGFSDGSTDACAMGHSRNAMSTSETSSVLCTEFIRYYDEATLATLDACSVTSLDASGYTLTWSAADATARKVTVIAIKGPGAKVVTSLQPTTNTTVDIDIGVVPKVGIVIGAMKTASETTSTHNRMLIGAWDELDNRDSIGWMDESGQTTTDTDRYVSAAHSIKNYDHARSCVGRATVSVQGNGIRETWDQTDGTERQHAWLLLSEDIPPAADDDDDPIVPQRFNIAPGGAMGTSFSLLADYGENLSPLEQGKKVRT